MQSNAELVDKMNGPVPYSEKTKIYCISHDIAKKSPMLILKVIEGQLLIGQVIQINAMGMVGGKRKDSCTYFGQCNSSDGVYNDFNFPAEELGVGKRHMMIKYSESSRKYCLKDLSDGTGTFVKINKPLKLVSNYIISFGDSHFTVVIDGSQITLKFLEGIRANEKRIFTLSDLPVTIGRHEGSTIVMNCVNLSKYHCRIIGLHDEFYLVDGDGKKGSTNGTWLYAENNYELEAGTIFKAGQSLFLVDIIESPELANL